jgi:hypothetical protein
MELIAETYSPARIVSAVMAVPKLLWRKVLAATIDTLRGESRGQYDIRLAKPAGIDAFFEGLPREPTELGGYNVQVPLEAAVEPVPVAATSIEVAYIGPESRRDDWRIPSQRPETAYPIWRNGTGLLDSTEPGDDFVLLVRDPGDRFHARWLRSSDLGRLPSSVAQVLTGSGMAGVEDLDAADWPVVADVLQITEGPEIEVPVAPKDADSLGEPYRPEDESVSTAQPDPFKVDPDVLDRGISGHRRTQNALATYLSAIGLTPLSHRPKIDPPFDIAWRQGDVLCVAEVKSLTEANQEKQLRLALGQVLRYAYQLSAGGSKVVPLIIVERRPTDDSWGALCESLGVRLAWPGAFEAALGSD